VSYLRSFRRQHSKAFDHIRREPSGSGTLHQKTVCIDLDGTLAEYHGWKGWEHIGKPVTKAVELVKMLHDEETRIIVFTCRMNKTMNKISGIDTVKMEGQILMWLIDHELSFCEVSSDEGNG